MKKEDFSQTTGLSKTTIKTFKNDGLLDSCDDEVGALTAISSLMVSRFSYEQVKSMHENQDNIRRVVEEHINEISAGDITYPILCDLLERIDLTDVQNVYQLGEKIKAELFLPADKAEQAEDIKKKCRDLQEQANYVSDEYDSADALDFFAMIPIIGLIAGFGRSNSLSHASDMMKVAYELNDSLSESLKGLQPNVDIAVFERENTQKGKFYDWWIPSLSTGNYINETTDRIKMMQERAFVINEQLNRLPIR